MKLLFITQKWDEHDSVLGFVPSWVLALGSRAQQVTVICLEQGSSTIPHTTTVFSLGKEHGATRMQRIWRFYTLVWKLRRSYDTVFVYMNPEYIVLAGFLWRFFGKRVVLWYAHGTVTWKLRIGAFFAHRILTSTPEGCRINSRKLRIVGQAIDTELFNPARAGRDSHEIRLVVVGRISPSKGQLLAIKAFTRLREEGMSATLTLIGAPVYESDRRYQQLCKQYVHEHDLFSHVIFAGAQERRQLAELLSAMTLCINMSTTGSLDKAGLEAIAAGVPLITGNEAFRSIVADTTPELMVEKTSTEDLVRAICWYVTRTEEEKGRIARTLREKVVRKHSVSTFAERVMNAL